MPCTKGLFLTPFYIQILYPQAEMKKSAYFDILFTYILLAKQKESTSHDVLSFALQVPAVGLEPTRDYSQQILSLHRLPFRHAG